MSGTLAPTIGQLQARVRQLETQLAELNAEDRVPRAELDPGKADHDATKVELANLKRKLTWLEDKIARGIVHNKGKDWDAPIVARQVGILTYWLEQNSC